MFAGISIVINSKAAGMSKTMRYTHKLRTWLNITLLYRNNYNSHYIEICEIKFHDFNKTFPGLEIAVLNFHSFYRFFMTVRTLLKATNARFQSLKIGPLPPLITGDQLPRFFPGPLNLQIKHWATLLKALLLKG